MVRGGRGVVADANEETGLFGWNRLGRRRNRIGCNRCLGDLGEGRWSSVGTSTIAGGGKACGVDGDSGGDLLGLIGQVALRPVAP